MMRLRVIRSIHQWIDYGISRYQGCRSTYLEMGLLALHIQSQKLLSLRNRIEGDTI